MSISKEEIEKWFLSEEGQAAIRDALERSRKLCEWIDQASKVEPKDMNRPMTI